MKGGGKPNGACDHINYGQNTGGPLTIPVIHVNPGRKLGVMLKGMHP